MSRCVVFAVLLATTFSVASGLDEVLQKYKNRYTQVEEADVERIGEFLKSPDLEERREAALQIAAAFRMGFSSAEKFIPVLVELLKTDSNEGVRTSAATALGRSRDPRGIEPLLEAARDTTAGPILRRAALGALSDMRVKKREVEEIAVEELDSPEYNLRFKAIQLVGRSEDPRKLERLMEAYLKHYESPEDTLKRTNAPLHGTAYEALSWIYSFAAAGIVYGAPELVPRLIGHPQPRIRLDVAQALAHKQDEKAIPIFIELVKSSDDPAVRWRAVRDLGHVAAERKDKEVISTLRQALDDQYTIAGKDDRPYRAIADEAYEALLRMGVEVEEPPDLRESRLPRGYR